MTADDPIDKSTPPPDAQAMTREEVIEGLVNKFLAWLHERGR